MHNPEHKLLVVTCKLLISTRRSVPRIDDLTVRLIRCQTDVRKLPDEHTSGKHLPC
jgi:hypothetical protein